MQLRACRRVHTPLLADAVPVRPVPPPSHVTVEPELRCIGAPCAADGDIQVHDGPHEHAGGLPVPDLPQHPARLRGHRALRPQLLRRVPVPPLRLAAAGGLLLRRMTQ